MLTEDVFTHVSIEQASSLRAIEPPSRHEAVPVPQWQTQFAEHRACIEPQHRATIEPPYRAFSIEHRGRGSAASTIEHATCHGRSAAHSMTQK